MGELSQALRAKGDHDTAYAIEILEERCALYVSELNVAKEHFLSIRDFLGEGKLEAIDNLADDVARTIARQLIAIATYPNGSASAPSEENT